MQQLVTIYITTYNRLELLRRAVNSVLNQTYENIEIIIVDDASIDNTHIYCERLTKTNERIKYIRNKENKGACFSRNVAINSASGRLITGLDDDDEFTNDRIERLVRFYTKGGYSFVAAGHYKCINSLLIPFLSSLTIISLDELKNQNVIGNQILTDTEYLKAIGGFDESFVAWQDYDTWFRLVNQYGAGYIIPEPLYIVHSEYEGERITNSKRAVEGYIQFVNKHRSLLNNENLLSLKLSDFINRNESIRVMDFLRYVYYPKQFVRALKYTLNKNCKFYVNLKRIYKNNLS